MEDIKLSEDPVGWVTQYLRERAKMELCVDYDVLPALDPQFDLYAVPKASSSASNAPDHKARHVLILPILTPAEDFGSADEQLAEVFAHIKPTFGDDYLIYAYDTETSLGEIHLTSDPDFIMRLSEVAICENTKNSEAADGN